MAKTRSLESKRRQRKKQKRRKRKIRHNKCKLEQTPGQEETIFVDSNLSPAQCASSSNNFLSQSASRPSETSEVTLVTHSTGDADSPQHKQEMLAIKYQKLKIFAFEQAESITTLERKVKSQEMELNDTARECSLTPLLILLN